jgi:protein-S-isoprenylcysteine O-methyltransferase Ste14
VSAPERRERRLGSGLVVAQLVLLAALFMPWQGFAPGPATIVLLLAGGALFAATLAVNRLGNFNVRPKPKPTGRLIVSGPYRFVRHPMYVALLATAAAPVASDAAPAKWALWVALAVVLRVKAALEEAGLGRLHPDYAAYRGRTGAFLPGVR